MKELILTNWNLWRIVRLVLGVLFVVAGIVNTDYLLAAGGGFVLFQAIFNAGCCSTGGNCSVNYDKNKENNDK
jgi:hypothetical protein